MSCGPNHSGQLEGPGNALQVAVALGHLETACAFAEEGLDVTAGVGELSASTILSWNQRTSEATVELLAEMGYEGFGALAKELANV